MENDNSLLSRLNQMNKRLDELNKKTDYSLFEIKKANISNHNVIYSYKVAQKSQSIVAGKGYCAARWLR